MAVIIGSARMDEHGRATGGKAGNQTGKEISTQNWYKHAKGWVLLRAKDPAQAERMARCMEAACKSPKIGYDQAQRLSLYNAIKPVGFDITKLKSAVETDCSALVRVCCAYAGIAIPDFITSDQVKRMMQSGAFDKSEADKHCKSSDYLRRGDVLVTRTKGHTVIVLSNGAKITGPAPLPAAAQPLRDDSAAEPQDGAMGQNPFPMPSTVVGLGAVGEGVKWVQWELTEGGCDLGAGGIDGEFGAFTLEAVLDFQRRHALDVDGEVGPKTMAALIAEVGRCEHDDSDNVPVDAPAVNAPVSAPVGFALTDAQKKRLCCNTIAADISHHDPKLDGSKYKAPFIWIRSGDSCRTYDANMQHNIKEAVKYGIPWGTYMFSRAGTKSDMKKEIDRWIANVRSSGHEPSLGWWFDIEVDSSTLDAVKYGIEYIKTIIPNEQLFGIYIANRLYSKYKKLLPLFDVIWVPRYSGKAPDNSKYHIHQYGFAAFAGVNGSKKTVDSNRPKPPHTWDKVFIKRT